MYLYKFGYHSYEDSSSYILAHKEKYTNEQFKNLIKDAYVNCTINKVRHLKDLGVTYWESSAYSDVDSEIYTYMIENYGFEALHIEANFNIFGWGDLARSEFWEGRREGSNIIGREFADALKPKWIEEFGGLPEDRF